MFLNLFFKAAMADMWSKYGQEWMLYDAPRTCKGNQITSKIFCLKWRPGASLSIPRQFSQDKVFSFLGPSCA